MSGSFVGRIGSIYGTVVRVINFSLSVLLLAVLHTTKARSVMTRYSSIDSELVTVI